MPTKVILDPSPLIVLSLLPLFPSLLSLKMVVGKFISLNLRGEYRYVIWNNREIKIDGKSVFYKRYLSQGIKSECPLTLSQSWHMMKNQNFSDSSQR